MKEETLFDFKDAVNDFKRKVMCMFTYEKISSRMTNLLSYLKKSKRAI